MTDRRTIQTRRISIKGLLQASVIVLIAVYLALVVGMYLFQRSFQYHPNPIASDPKMVGLRRAETVTIKTADGEMILAWHHKAELGKPTIIFFHGNGGGISTRAGKQAFFANRGFGFLAVSYRGYEGSSGSPSEAGFIQDAESALDWLIASGIEEKHVFVLGESLGTGVAVQLAAKRKIGALALEAPYANAVDVGAAVYWYLPVKWLMKDQFRSVDYITKVSAPLFIVHGALDGLIPLSQGQQLFKSANEPKNMFVLDDKGHSAIADERSWSAVAQFFDTIAKQP
jgi:uncharacterized protein